MNYQLSSEEMAQVMELVDYLHAMRDGLSDKDARDMARLMRKIKEWLK